jgi:hypothetical protein
MTVYKSDAAQAGLMPDYSRAGVVLCRSAEYTVTTEPISGDTIEMVPIPKNAQIINIMIENSSLNQWASLATMQVGDGDDTDRHFLWPFTGVVNQVDFYGCNTLQRLKTGTYMVHTYSQNDTIDFYFNGTMNSDVTGCSIAMHVFYKMEGSIADEAF